MIFAMHALRIGHPHLAFALWTFGSIFGLAGYVIAWLALLRTFK